MEEEVGGICGGKTLERFEGNVGALGQRVHGVACYYFNNFLSFWSPSITGVRDTHQHFPYSLVNKISC
jgi:hypothetical protein